MYDIFYWYLFLYLHDIYTIFTWYLHDVSMILAWYLQYSNAYTCKIFARYLHHIYMIFTWYLHDIYMKFKYHINSIEPNVKGQFEILSQWSLIQRILKLPLWILKVHILTYSFALILGQAIWSRLILHVSTNPSHDFLSWIPANEEKWKIY